MLGRKCRDQLELFVTGSLEQLVPEDHVLARVDRVLDLGWLRKEVAECYCADNGRPDIDPEVAVRLILAGLLLGIVHDRRLLREAQVNIAIRWFIGYGLHERLPDHSSLTRIRQRCGEERFRAIFQRTVRACLEAKIATAEVVHIDASLIRADVSWESLVERHADEVMAENRGEAEVEAEKKGRQSGKYNKVSRTDPDASMATTARNRRLEPCYKQHAAVDDERGVVLDVAVTTGEVNEGDLIEAQVDAVQEIADRAISTVTADAGYAYGEVYGGLERRGIDPLIPAKREPIKSRVPLRRFCYDARHDIEKCPREKVLRPGPPVKHGRFFYSRARDCARCRLKANWSVEGASQQGGGDRQRLPGPAPRPSQACALGRARSRAVPTPSLAFGGLPRRGQDLARVGPSGPARLLQHEDPGLPDGGGGQFQAARRRRSRRFVGYSGRRMRRPRLATRSSRLGRPTRTRNGCSRMIPHTPPAKTGVFRSPTQGPGRASVSFIVVSSRVALEP